MSLRMSSVLIVSLLTVAVAAPAFTAQPNNKRSAPLKKVDEIYRCKDATGQSRVSQSIPSECLDLDVEVLDKNGQVVRVLPGKVRRAEIEAEKIVKANEKEQKRKAQERDRMLLSAYNSVKEIERDQDERIKMLDARASVTLQNVDNLNKQQARLQKQILRYRPYNESPEAKPLPEDLAKQAVRMVDNRKAYEAEIAEIEAEKVKIREKYAADIARFKELKPPLESTP